MLRHSAFFMLREESTPEQQMQMLKGLAYMRFACPMVRALDFGTDLFGGSALLREVKPWKRAPKWRSQKLGPAMSYDVALHLDFDDLEGLEAYNVDDVHHEVAVYNASICQGEITARVDWWYDDEPPIVRDQVKHSAMFLWSDETDDATKELSLDALRGLQDTPQVEQVLIGKNVGDLTTDFDFIVDIRCATKEAAAELIAGEEYARVMKQVGEATQYEWTARLSHTMHGL
ncbi:Dabb family protein [Mycobacterium sp. 236(2023)]|uniref:Dabb family protein n=1 Tax=Mycobacterium sp. 236(2023) TaxID=3038163 RepID=UPI002415356D|nr:Dabb family protein [Mycobacterium sp. 236(2023)]MDG4663770.1 Dabb family protein [Mycobacterium sp. 236(2023)]